MCLSRVFVFVLSFENLIFIFIFFLHLFSKELLTKTKTYVIMLLANKRIRFAELCNGSTADSDSVCEGSNPSSAAKDIQAPLSQW